MVYGHGGRVSQRRPTGGSHTASHPRVKPPRRGQTFPTRQTRCGLAVAPIDRAYPPRAMARWQPEGPTFPFP